MKFNFTSQICTTKEQSERLLALGLKTETADMRYILLEGDLQPCIRAMPWNSICIPCQNNFPTWSLHRLIEMMPSFINIGEYAYALRIIRGKLFAYRSNIAGDTLLFDGGNLYDAAIYTIEWLIKEGHFHKEYLEE